MNLKAVKLGPALLVAMLGLGISACSDDGKQKPEMMADTMAKAEKVVIRVQSVIPSKADEVHMLNEFGKDVYDLTNGSVEIEVLPAGAVCRRQGNFGRG